MVQGLLLVLCGLCVPWMLLIKPFILRYQHNSKKASLEYAALGRGIHEDEEEHGESAHGESTRGFFRLAGMTDLG